MENIYKSKLVKDGKIDVLIISHQDADGIGSAALALVDIEARGGFGTIITDMNPSTTTTDEMIKSVEDIDNYELIFILDRAPLSEELMKTLRKDITVIYIDHHETNFDIARKMTDEFEGFTGILNKNDSAALITADFFGFDNKIINLIDEWDTFKWTNKQDELKCSVHEILNFNFIAKSIDSTLLFSEIKKVLDGTSSVSKLMITYRQAIKVARFEIFDCSESLNRSDNITELPNSKKLLVLNFTPPFSVGGIALAGYLKKHPDTIILYKGNHPNSWALRSTGDTDVSEIAKLFGGGGHKNASGFTYESSEDKIADEIIKRMK